MGEEKRCACTISSLNMLPLLHTTLRHKWEEGVCCNSLDLCSQTALLSMHYGKSAVIV